ncbi:uncharacterized protein [Palaemon carinicauda]|uniref:uncharacterized protein n=1 Tax=Palaemon carinicauda TaxID=392227 RepID=UPI0035B5DE2F
MLQTDASRLHGLGFALLQKHGTDWKLTQCGSRFLSDVETRYSVIELEMTAVLWSIKKCHTYLAGLPHFDVLKTDGGPQFAASALRRFLSRWGVEHRITSPYNPKANGHAEASVKIIKKLIMTTTKNGNLDADEFAHGMLELRNTPRADGRSPAQVLFGHPLKSFIPTHRRSFAKEWQRKAEECDVKAEYLRSQVKQRYDSTARPLSHLKMGSYVDVQDHNTKLWNRPGVVVGIGARQDYLIKLGSGRILWRNRKFLRPHRPFLPIYGSSIDATNTPNKPKDEERSQDNSTAEVIEQPVSPTPAPRRSLRHKKEPDRLRVKWNKNTYE